MISKFGAQSASQPGGVPSPANQTEPTETMKKTTAELVREVETERDLARLHAEIAALETDKHAPQPTSNGAVFVLTAAAMLGFVAVLVIVGWLASTGNPPHRPARNAAPVNFGSRTPATDIAPLGDMTATETAQVMAEVGIAPPRQAARALISAVSTGYTPHEWEGPHHAFVPGAPQVRYWIHTFSTIEYGHPVRYKWKITCSDETSAARILKVEEVPK